MTKKLVFLVAAALCLTLTGCKESGDTTEPSDGSGGGGGGGGGGTVTLPACTLGTGGSASGDYVDTHGIYKDVAMNGTISSVTMYFTAATGNGGVTGSQTIGIEARHCGFDSAQTVGGTASSTITLSSSSTLKPATFTFSSPIAMNTNCGSGTDRITFKVTSLSGANTAGNKVLLGIVQSGNMACTMKMSANVTAAAPAQQSTWEVIGAVQ